GPLRAFRALDGAPRAAYPASGFARELGARLLLGHDGVDPPPLPEPVDLAAGLSLGEPLLLGEEFLATSLGDRLFSWSPLRPARFLSFTHGLPVGLRPELSLPARLGGYPMAD